MTENIPVNYELLANPEHYPIAHCVFGIRGLSQALQMEYDSLPDNIQGLADALDVLSGELQRCFFDGAFNSDAKIVNAESDVIIETHGGASN